MDEQWVDQRVVELAISGDRDAIETLWRGVRRWVAAVLLAHKPRETDLEDLLQHVALKVCTGIGDLRDPKGFKAWLRTVTINTARADGRKTTRRRAGFLKLVGAGGIGRMEQERDVELSEHARSVLDAALELPERYREPVILRCLHAMSHKEIGEVMGLPETTVETRIARGRRMLREELERRERRQTNEDDEERERAELAATGGVS